MFSFAWSLINALGFGCCTEARSEYREQDKVSNGSLVHGKEADGFNSRDKSERNELAGRETIFLLATWLQLFWVLVTLGVHKFTVMRENWVDYDLLKQWKKEDRLAFLQMTQVKEIQKETSYATKSCIKYNEAKKIY